MKTANGFGKTEVVTSARDLSKGSFRGGVGTNAWLNYVAGSTAEWWPSSSPYTSTTYAEQVRKLKFKELKWISRVSMIRKEWNWEVKLCWFQVFILLPHPSASKKTHRLDGESKELGEQSMIIPGLTVSIWENWSSHLGYQVYLIYTTIDQSEIEYPVILLLSNYPYKPKTL